MLLPKSINFIFSVIGAGGFLPCWVSLVARGQSCRSPGTNYSLTCAGDTIVGQKPVGIKALVRKDVIARELNLGGKVTVMRQKDENFKILYPKNEIQWGEDDTNIALTWLQIITYNFCREYDSHEKICQEMIDNSWQTPSAILKMHKDDKNHGNKSVLSIPYAH